MKANITKLNIELSTGKVISADIKEVKSKNVYMISINSKNIFKIVKHDDRVDISVKDKNKWLFSASYSSMEKFIESTYYNNMLELALISTMSKDDVLQYAFENINY